jgi:hypothetical protein
MGGLVNAIFGGNDAPPPPDYAAAARETAAGNKEAAQFAVNANRINQVTPYGSLTYSRAQPAFDQAGYDAAMAEFQSAPTTQSPSRVYTGDDGYGNAIYADGPAQTQQARTAPRREDFMAPDDGGGWTQTMNLTPQAQATLDNQMALSNQYSQAATAGFNNIRGLMENPNIDTSRMPQMRGIDMSQVGNVRGLDNSGMSAVRNLTQGNAANIRSLDNSDMGAVGGGISTANLNDIRSLNNEGLQDVRQLGLDGLPQAPINAGQTAQDALFSRMNPSLARDDEALRTRLANQGIALGSSAYNREMDLAGQRANDMRLQAAAQGISLDQAARNAAFGERKDLSAFDMGLNQQQFGQRQAMTSADLATRNQMFGENQAAAANALAARSQAFGERQAISNFDLNRSNQNFAQRQALSNFDLQRNNQQFGQNQAMSNFDLARTNQQFGQQQNLASMSGQQRNQALQEAFALQSRPLDLVNALRSGSQVQNPQFQNFAQQQTTTGPNMSQAAQLGYEGQMGLFNAGEARDERTQNMMMQAAGMFMSDRRTKENIQKIGVLDNGLNLYKFDYKPEFKEIAGHGSYIGVMADEAKVIPNAVIRQPNGYDMVDYSKIYA